MTGVNGASGNIGRLVFQELIREGQIVGVVNDIVDTKDVVRSINRNDSVHGKPEFPVRQTGDKTMAYTAPTGIEREVKVNKEREPKNIIWDDEIVVVDCSGQIQYRHQGLKHFERNDKLKSVVVSAPMKDESKTIIMGINQQDYSIEDKVISNASCTTKSLVMGAQALADYGYKIHALHVDTTHAATNTQNPLDGPHGRGALNSINAHATGAALATGKVMPNLVGLLEGYAMRVPTSDGSFSNISMVVSGKDCTREKINEVIVASSMHPKYMGRTDVFWEENAASVDIVGNGANAVLIHKLTSSTPVAQDMALVRIVMGYDNELGSARDAVLLAKYCEEKQYAQ